MKEPRFQVALSFTGEQRSYVEVVAESLGSELGRENVFYDEWYKPELARPNLDTYLQDIYHDNSKLVVMFMSANYDKKEWCGLEWRALRDLIKIKRDESLMLLKFEPVSISGLFGIDGYIDIQNTPPEKTASYVIARLNGYGTTPEFSRLNAIHFNSDRLPSAYGEFVGRESEIEFLDSARTENSTRIVELVAAGGTGKTKLIRHWLDFRGGRCKNLLAWSFYSQGSNEDRQVSTTPFFDEAFRILQSNRTTFASEEDKGTHLAGMLSKSDFILVLDGLEPLQHAGRGMRGEIKDRAIRALLFALIKLNTGLCIITTRIATPELLQRPYVAIRNLQDLDLVDAARLLKLLNVHGSDFEIAAACKEYACNALALHLLGNAISTYLDGNVNRRDELPQLIDNYDEVGRHAFRVMQSYDLWLRDPMGAPTPELRMLYILGLFDHPLQRDALEVLWKAAIPDLTADVPEQAWYVAIRDLAEKHHLLFQTPTADNTVDCHPLIREYFSTTLKRAQPEAFKRAHFELYEYYKSLPLKRTGKEKPETLEDMRPLLQAVTHGCAAGIHQQVLDEVYDPFISQDGFYIWKKLGAPGDFLSCISNFFDKPWRAPAEQLTGNDRLHVFNWAGVGLEAMGRFEEAAQALRSSVDAYSHARLWPLAVVSAVRLSGVLILCGNLAGAEAVAREALVLSDQEDARRQQLGFRSRIALADALLRQRKIVEGTDVLVEALRRNQYPDLNPQPHRQHRYIYNRPPISLGYSITTAYQCFTSLQTIGNNEAAIGIATQLWQDPHPKDDSILGEALVYLMVATLSIGGDIIVDGLTPWQVLSFAIEKVRRAGFVGYLPIGLLVRVRYARALGNYAQADLDLCEIADLCASVEMPLHLTDYHLESALLLMTSSSGAEPSTKANSCSQHIQQANNLINKTGFRLRSELYESIRASVAKTR